MQLLEDGVLAALAAVGAAALLYLPLSALARPGRRFAAAAFAVVPCGPGEGAALEPTVRALRRARNGSGGFGRIVILDRGMGEEEKRIAALLCREGPEVTICTAGALAALADAAHGGKETERGNV